MDIFLFSVRLLRPSILELAWVAGELLINRSYEYNNRPKYTRDQVGLCGTDDRWIPCTSGRLRGKCFHLMTSSCVWMSADISPQYISWQDPMFCFHTLVSMANTLFINIGNRCYVHQCRCVFILQLSNTNTASITHTRRTCFWFGSMAVTKIKWPPLFGWYF